jgi:hypothetical protein
MELYGQTQMDKKEQLAEAVLKSADGRRGSDGRKRLTCGEAFELAKEFKTEVADVGRICNQQNIKICKCQLGCFR